MKPIKITVLCAPLVSLLLCSCGGQKSADAAGEPAKDPATPVVEVTRVISQKLNTTARLPAQLTPYEAVDIYPKVTGFVKWIKVDRGSRVTKGESIAQLEAPELVAQRAEAESRHQGAQSQLAAGEAKLSTDRATYERLKAASQTPGVIALNDLETSQRVVESQQATVEALKKNVMASEEALRAVSQMEAYLVITAPFDGQVTERNVHPGALVGPGSGAGAMNPIVRIQTLTRLRLIVPVPEAEAFGITLGREVKFTVPSSPGRLFTAPIARISRDVDLKTRTMPVELDVRDPGAELSPGTFCEVTWPVNRTYPTLFVPSSAVASDLARKFVIRIRNNQTEWVDVKTGIASQNIIEVFGDLKEGDTVAIRGTDELRSGTQVSPHMSSTR